MERIRCVSKLIDKTNDGAHIREFGYKQRAARRYNSKVVLREMKKGDLVLRHVIIPSRQGKLQINWEGPYLICPKLSCGAYKLEKINRRLIPRTSNSVNLIYYYS